jgi:hypothetical protein
MYPGFIRFNVPTCPFSIKSYIIGNTSGNTVIELRREDGYCSFVKKLCG